MIFIGRIAYFSLTFFITLTSGQIRRPEVISYTQETVYQKLKINYPYIQPIQVTLKPTIEVIKDKVYKTGLHYDLYNQNNSTKKYPVLLIHGGGWITGSKENLTPYAQSLANEGFLVMNINYSLSDQAKYPQALIDIKDAINLLNQISKLNKVILIGTSAGGLLANLVGVKNPTMVQAIINIDGILSFIHPESKEGISANYWFNATIDESYKVWKEASPLEYVDQTTPPTYFINSNQKRFSAGKEDYIQKLNSYQIKNNSYYINAPHSFWLVQPWFDETLNYLKQILNTIND